MQPIPEFDQTSFEMFLDAHKNKDYEEIIQYLHQDFVFSFNKHVFKLNSYLWFLKLTYPLIAFELNVKDLIILEKSITCKLYVDVKILKDSQHFLVGKILKNQYWKGCIPAAYELKDGKISAIHLKAEHIQPLTLSH